jgi:hypothetical protein
VGCLLVFLPLALAFLLLPPAELVRDAWRLRRATATAIGRIDDVRAVYTSRRRVLRRDVAYSYEVNGRRYTGRHGGEGFSQGNEATVYFDPVHPDVSFLVRGLHLSSVGLTMFGWGLGIVIALLTRVPHGRDLLRLRYVPVLALPLAGAAVFGSSFRTGRMPWEAFWFVASWSAAALVLVAVLVLRYRWGRRPPAA